jgi:hypothetical protein
MANLRKGLIRILWVFSISTSIIAWILLFRASDLRPERKINNVGVAFINQLDKHYFIDAQRLKLSEFLLIKANKDRIKLDKVTNLIEKSILSDSLSKWPYVWEWKSQINSSGFDVAEASASLVWQERLRKALKANEGEIMQTFPDLDFVNFLKRYAQGNVLISKSPSPEYYYNISYPKPYGRIGLILFMGLLPFIMIWIFWFLMVWIIKGFRD